MLREQYEVITSRTGLDHSGDQAVCGDEGYPLVQVALVKGRFETVDGKSALLFLP